MTQGHTVQTKERMRYAQKAKLFGMLKNTLYFWHTGKLCFPSVLKIFDFYDNKDKKKGAHSRKKVKESGVLLLEVLYVHDSGIILFYCARNFLFDL